MNKILRTISILGLIGMLFTLIISCEKTPGDLGNNEGNQNSNGPSDAGSFEDPREKFLGFYQGTNACNHTAYWDGSGFGFYVKEDPDDPDKVIVEFPYGDIYDKKAWVATVDRNNLIFNDKIENQANDCEENSTKEFTLALTGTASLNGNTFRFPDFTYTVLNGANEVICVVSCNVNGEKR